MRWSLALVVVAVIVTSGCALFASEEVAIPDHIIVDASDPLFIEGWSYDGSGVTEADGSMRIDVVNSSATGDVTGTVDVGDLTYEFRFNEFIGAPNKPSHANGINQDFPEHGDSGNGHANIPKIHAVTSGWGSAGLTVDGRPVLDPVRGRPTLAGHFMVTDTGVRDTDRKIYADDGSLYDPSKAGNGRTYDGDNEVHVIFRSRGDYPDYDPVKETGTLTPDSPSATVTVPVQAAETNATIHVNVSAPQGDVTPARVNATLLTPTGQTIRSQNLGVVDQTNSVTWEIPSFGGIGNYAVELDSGGQGAADWNVDAMLRSPEKLFVHFLFETASWQAGS